MESIGAYLPLLLIVVAFWFLILRPARKRQAEQQAVVSALAPGARVMTTAGLFGTVVAVEGTEVELEIAPGVVVRYVTAAVAKVDEVVSSVSPSPGARATSAVPITPIAPARFSITKGWPRVSASLAPSRRANRSAVPPGG